MARDHEVSLLKEELRLCSPDYVAHWLEGRRGVESLGVLSDIHRIDDETIDLELLARGERLVDLALARYTIQYDVLTALWDREDRLLSLAILSNNCYAKSLHFQNIPDALGPLGPSSPEWLTRATAEELGALFSNPTLNRRFIASVLKREREYENLPWDRVLQIVGASAGNPIFSEEYEDRNDGFAHYLHDAPISAAWQLLEAAPVDASWANALPALLEGALPHEFVGEKLRRLVGRWVGPLSKAEEESEQSPSQERKALQGAQAVRYVLFKHCSAGDMSTEALLTSVDPAARCAAYATRPLGEAAMRAGVAMDGLLAYGYLLSNKYVWMGVSSRTVMHSMAWQVGGEGNTMYAPAWRDSAEKQWRELHPDWFVAMESSTVAEPVDHDAQLQLQALIESVATRLSAVESTVATVHRRATWLLVGVALLLLVGILHTLTA